MHKENFYTLRATGDRISQQNAAELANDAEKPSGIRCSYAMHTPGVEIGPNVGRPEDARCKYFCTP